MNNESTTKESKKEPWAFRKSTMRVVYAVWFICMVLGVVMHIITKNYSAALWQAAFTWAYIIYMREAREHLKTLGENINFLTEMVTRMDKLAKDALKAEKEAK